VAHHRFFVALTAGFAFFEWRVRTGRLTSLRAASVFPLACAAGGAFLLTHSHGLETARQQILIELPHNGIAVLGIVAGGARWLELRLPARDRTVPAWIWPLCDRADPALLPGELATWMASLEHRAVRADPGPCGGWRTVSVDPR
jgi:putative copper resistance protein D